MGNMSIFDWSSVVDGDLLVGVLGVTINCLMGYNCWFWSVDVTDVYGVALSNLVVTKMYEFLVMENNLF